MQQHLFADWAQPFDFGEVVVGDGINQPGKNIVALPALLLGDANAGVDERRAGGFEFDRRGRGYRDICRGGAVITCTLSSN